MINVGTLSKLRRMVRRDGVSVREAARTLGISRTTASKWLESQEMVQPRYPKRAQVATALDPFKEQLRMWLAADVHRGRRERRGNKAMFDAIRALGYRGSSSTVYRFCRAWQDEQRDAPRNAGFVPLHFDLGEAFQFDWSCEYAFVGGLRRRLEVAHMKLAASRAFLLVAYYSQAHEMLFDAHARGFAVLGGVTRRGIYDNMKTAVDAIFVGKERQYNRRFLQMCSHHLVDPVACTPASGWEKGQVENQVGLVRERFFTPRLRVKTYDELNAWLTDKCVAYARVHPHPERPDQTVWEVFEEERPNLVPYRGRFDGFHALPASVSKTCLVRFDNNKYSVNASAVGRPVEIHAYADRIVIRQDGRAVAEHARHHGRGETVYDPWHYVPVLARKPGALRNGAPFKDWVLPAALERVRRKLAGSDDGDRQMVAILATVLTDGLPAVEAACAQAMSEGVHSSDVIINILARQRDPGPAATILTPDALRLRHAPLADCARYDQLRST